MYYKINRNKQFNFQINRVLMYGKAACDKKLISKELKNVKNIDQWYQAFINVAAASKKYLHIAYAYRMAEFFLEYDDPRKSEVSIKCLSFFHKGFEKLGITFEQHSISFDGGKMKCFRFPCQSPKGTLVICGGYDSFIEEFVLQVYEFAKEGYEIILFEGPGQGECIGQGLHFRYDFDKATSAVLDYFNVQECAFLGISWGGYFAIRSAAFDKRITKTIMYDVLLDGYEVMIRPLPSLLKRRIGKLIKAGRVNELEALCTRICNRSMMARWMFHQGKHITGADTFYDMYKRLARHNVKSFHEKVSCNLLILAGEKDHYIPISHYKQCKHLFPNAKSVKMRLFTKKEGGQQHCQIGNPRLAIEEIINWLENI